MVLATYDLAKVRLLAAGLLVLGWLTLGIGFGIWLIVAGIWVLVRSGKGADVAIACDEAGIAVRNPFFASRIAYADYRQVRTVRPGSTSGSAPSWVPEFLVLEAAAGGAKGLKAHYLPLKLLKMSADGPAGIDRAIRDHAGKIGTVQAETPANSPAPSAPRLTGTAPPLASSVISGARPPIPQPRQASIPKTLEGDRVNLR